MKLDRIDMKILYSLENNARQTNANLSEQVGLSASPCLARVRRLEKAGFIKRYVAEIDWKRVDPYIVVIANFSLKCNTRRLIAEFEKSISRIKEARSFYQICGEFDYSVQFQCRNMDAYNSIIEELCEGEVAIARMTSTVVLREARVGSGPSVRDVRPPSLRIVND